MRQGSGESVANGRYEIGHVIGRGRRSRVHAAYDHVLHRPVACKFLPSADDEATPRWKAEAAALNRFDHAHLVRLLDGGEAGDEAFLVLPLMTESLSARLERSALSRDNAAAVVVALADALGHVHRAGLVHGAVDAEGILLDPFGRPCWSGLPDPGTSAEPRVVDRDLNALALLAVRCVNGDRRGGTAPTAVLDAVRVAADHGRVAGVGRRMASSLETVTPVPVRAADRVARTAHRMRLRGRPGFAAALAAGFAASVVGAIVVGGAARTGAEVELGGPGPSAVLADPSASDLGSSVQGALNRLGALAAEPAPAAAPSREPRVARVAEESGGRSRAPSTEPAPERTAPVRDTSTAPAPQKRDDDKPRDDHADSHGEAHDDEHDRGPDRDDHDRDDDGGDERADRGLVSGLVSDLL